MKINITKEEAGVMWTLLASNIDLGEEGFLINNDGTVSKPKVRAAKSLLAKIKEL